MPSKRSTSKTAKKAPPRKVAKGPSAKRGASGSRKPTKASKSKASKPSKASKSTKASNASKSSKASKAAKSSKGAKASRGGKKHAKTSAAAGPGNRCIATDPFGGPCQNTPRLGSRYCGVHSHLEAMA